MRVYHTGFQITQRPDVRYGRRNADFGQGFYVTPDQDFALRWAKERKGEDTFVNVYELEAEGLTAHRFSRDGAWRDYIFANRAGGADTLAGTDLIIGPVANDTLFNTLGIISSGFLSPREALTLLKIGPEYGQIALKTEAAAAQLHWLDAQRLGADALRSFARRLAREEEAYLRALAEKMERLDGN